MIVRGLVGLCFAAAGFAAQDGPIRIGPHAAWTDPVPDSSPIANHSDIIERTRRVVRDYMDKLPDFICTRTMRTSSEWPGSAMEVASETVVAEGRFVNGRESYSVVSVNGKPGEGSRDPLQIRIWGGLVSKLWLWFHSQAETRFERSRDAMVKGRHAYAFRAVNSHPVDIIGGGGANPDGSFRLLIHVGFRGWAFIEKTSGNVLRLVAEETLRIPATHPVRQYSYRIDYDYVSIADSVHLLPVKRLNWWYMRNGWVIKDVIDYTDHRRFDVDSSIVFSESTPTNK